jgi:hypothetical protein
MRRISAGEITFPHFGHTTASSDARTFSRLIFQKRGMVRGYFSKLTEMILAESDKQWLVIALNRLPEIGQKKKAERWGWSGPKVDWRSRAVREGRMSGGE